MKDMTRSPEGPEQNKECGCVEQPYDDGTIDIRPCTGHAFVQAAQSLTMAQESLARAIQLIGYAGTRIAEGK